MQAKEPHKEAAHEVHQNVVLVVDDEDLIRKMLRRILAPRGFEVVTASDGQEAKDLLNQRRFDLVLTDINMPRVSGLEILRMVREQDEDLPVIVFTGSPTADNAIGALKLRATGYLQKPVTPESVLEEVDKAMKLHELAEVRRDAHTLLQQHSERQSLTSTMEMRLGSALDSLFMVYQPIVSWKGKRAFGYEALVRCKEPSIPHPGVLFETAEQLGKLRELGRAIRNCCTEPLEHCDPDMSLFVNLHPEELLDDELYDDAGSLSRYASRIVLELTERAELGKVPDVETRIRTLRQLGFRIAIDDIGAGYSGLNSFVMLRPDMVKLDMSLVRDIDTDPVRQGLAKMLLTLCADMGIAVVAEGIETARERDVLLEAGCELFQGYLFARPGPPFVEPTFED